MIASGNHTIARVESSDLRIFNMYKVKLVRRSFDSRCSLRMTYGDGEAERFGCMLIDALRATARVAPTR